VFTPGSRVLSLWRVDNEEWSSMFYRATVVETSGDKAGNTNLRLFFEGDSEIHEVPRSKAIKFENRSTRAAQSRNEASSNVSRVRRTPPGQQENPPSKKHKSSDDNCSTDDSDPSDSFGMSDSQYIYRGYSVLEKKMRNYRSILLERYNEAHKATLLNI